jgi:hypothetical protein
MMFYERVVPLNSEAHRHLKYKRSADFGFARRANSVPLLAAEFALALKHYPIVFVQAQDGATMPLALLGLADGVNGFVNAEGQWTADYVPAFVRRYPFVPAQQDDGQEMVCFDEACDRFNDSEGEPLFVEGQERSPLMEQVMGLLTDYHQQASVTQRFCQRLQDLDLLEASNATLRSPDGAERNLGGFMVVKEERLKALTAEVVHELVGNGAMGLIYAHLMSMSNIPRIPLGERVESTSA